MVDRAAIAFERDTFNAVPAPLLTWPTAPLVDLPLTSDATTAGATFTGAATIGRGTNAWYPDTAEPPVYSLKTGANLSGNALGTFLEPTRVNYSKNYNAAPVADASITVDSGAAPSVVADAAALALSGLANICAAGNVYTYTNSSGATRTITIASDATFPGGTTSLRCFAKIPAGSLITMQTSDAAHLGALVMGPTAGLYVDYFSQNILLVSAAADFVFSVPDGHSFSWVLNQIEVGASTSTPIVTAGAKFQRNGTTLTIPCASNWPNQADVMVEVEITPYKVAQDSGACVFSAYQDSNNWLQITVGNPPQVSKRTDGSSYSATSRSTLMLETHRIIARLSPDGVQGFYAGARCQARNINADALSITAGAINIGRKGDSSQYFSGRIRNVRIYSMAPTDRACIRRTISPKWEIDFCENMAGPAIMPNGHLYALKYDGTNWRDIYRSTDDGSTWVLWKTTAGASATEVCSVDFDGNVYYSTSAVLKRIDAITKAETTAITYLVNTNGAGASTPVTLGAAGNIFTYQNWMFGQSGTDGAIYVGQYQSTQLGGQLIWKSPRGGLAFTSKQTLLDGTWAGTTTERHCHQVKVNPFDGSIWLACGDGVNRGIFRSTNGLAVGTFAGDVSTISVPTLPGPTGLSFTAEAAYIGTDGSGSQNYVQQSIAGSAAANVITLPNPVQISPIFSVQCVNDNELWFLITEDAITQSGATSPKNQWSAVFKAIKTQGANSPWQVARVIALESARINGCDYSHIACTAGGVVPPDSKYIFATRRRYSPVNIPADSAGYFRIRRA